MGCDIHFHREVKINGKWEYFGEFKIERNYRLFSFLANVRNENKLIKPIADAEDDLPGDVSGMMRFVFNSEDNDYYLHTLTVFDYGRIEEFYNRFDGFIGETGDHEYPEHYVGYLFGNSWLKDFGEQFTNEKIEDVRWIFWFDN